MKLWFKTRDIPASNDVKTVEAVQLWMVRWVSARAILSSHYDQIERVEAFTSQQEADEFAKSLRQACKILGNRMHKDVIVEKN